MLHHLTDYKVQFIIEKTLQITKRNLNRDCIVCDQRAFKTLNKKTLGNFTQTVTLILYNPPLQEITKDNINVGLPKTPKGKIFHKLAKHNYVLSCYIIRRRIQQTKI